MNFVNPDNYTIAISDDKKSATVQWLYFDPGQRIRITFIHSGGDGTNVTVTGKFFETALALQNVPKSTSEYYGRKFTRWFLGPLFILCLILLIYVPLYLPREEKPSAAATSIAGIVFGGRPLPGALAANFAR
jgi:hypothetical protein